MYYSFLTNKIYIMETEKQHRTTNNSSNTSELFVCFTLRLSSSSMKLSSKPILSPSRSRDQPQISLSSSLSRRLKSNGSMKGGQASPMFPTCGKKRGVGFENPEPSSPKVTCIGQVRVKTKKQGKKMRSKSLRRSEASFRRSEQHHQQQPDLITRQNSQSFQFQNHRNQQKWVHLPLTICEALREFSCFFPCRSSCMSNENKEKEGKSNVRSGREGSCGAAFARWLVGCDGKGREIDDDDGGRENDERSYSSQRRHIFEDLDIDLVDEKVEEEFEDEEVEDKEEEKEKEKGRVSICVPPKNALLLMRCRSDPVKMAALANRFWESPIHKEQENEHKHEEHHHNEVEDEDSGDEDEDSKERDEQHEEGCKEQNIEMEQMEEEPQQVLEVEKVSQDEEYSICEREKTQAFCSSSLVSSPTLFESKTNQVEEEPIEEKDEEDKVETFTCVLLDSPHADIEKPETEETHQSEDPKEEEKPESSELSSSFTEIFVTGTEHENEETEVETEPETEEKVSMEEEEEPPTQKGSDPEMSQIGSMEREKGSKKEERESETLPECLLLMMCEPKLSMEVSKETWVCSTDFIRWLPERPVGKVAGGEKKVVVESTSLASKPKVKVKHVQQLVQPPRSSCSFPVNGGGAGMPKFVGCSKSRNGYDPCVLTRCNSEPVRSAAKLAAPEACFWNNRKLEPHPPPASLGIGAPAGVGF